VEVLAENRVKESDLGGSEENRDHWVYSVYKPLTYDVSLGVTKVTIKGYYLSKMSGKSLAFFNDLSLRRLLNSNQTFKFECQLYGESDQHVASLFVHMRRDGEPHLRYNIFSELVSRVQINKEQLMIQNPEQAKAIEEYEKSLRAPNDSGEKNEMLPALSATHLTEAFLAFVQRIGPLVDIFDTVYDLISLKDTMRTLTIWSALSYAIIYQE
jgi:hypothetical protein